MKKLIIFLSLVGICYSAGRFDLINSSSGNFAIEQGATFQHRITWFDSNSDTIDMSGYTVQMMIREKFTTDTVLSISTGGNGITMPSDSMYFTIIISAIRTAVLDFDKPHIYDVKVISPDGIVTRLLEGQVELRKQVTR